MPTSAVLWFSGSGSVVPLNVLFQWPSTNGSIPAGYTRETGMDTFFAKLIPTTGTNPGSTGGVATHDHSANGGSTHTHPYPSHSNHTFGVTGSAGHGGNASSGGISADGGESHTHATNDGGPTTTISTDGGGATTWSTENLSPSHLVVIWIKSLGTHKIPNAVLAFYNGGAPTGFSEYVNARDRLFKGAAAGGDGGATAGADSHTHGLASHTHPRATTAHVHTLTFGTYDSSTTQNVGDNPTVFTPINTSGHGHTSTTSGSTSFAAGSTGAQTDTSGSGDLAPPWKKLLCVENTSGTGQLPVGIVGGWLQTLASIPAKWALLDGAGGRPNYCTGDFLRGANGSAQNGNTGGATTHTHGSGSHFHTDSTGHTHTSAGTSGTPTGTTTSAVKDEGALTVVHPGNTTAHAAGTDGTSGGPTATSATSISAAANSSNNPSYKEIALIQYTG